MTVVNGLPAHALLLHFLVVLIPLTALHHKRRAMAL
jgi:hypothetical protein